MADNSLKVPPHSLEAEKSTLGSLLIDKEAITRIADLLQAEDFYHESHGTIYQAIFDLFDKRSPIDLLTVTNVLEERKQLEQVGGASYLAELTNEVPTASHVYNYALIVKHKSTLRKLIKAGGDVTGFGYMEDAPIEELLEQAEKALFSVSQTFLKDRFVHIKEILSSTYDKVSELHDPATKDKYRGIPTGFADMDNILSGLQPADLVILAARPSMGKTSLALNIAQNVAKKGHAVGIMSLEMSKEQLVERMFCSLLEVDSWKLRTGQLTEEDFMRIGNVMDELYSMKIFIDDSVGNSIAELKAKARRLQMEHGLNFLIIDYLQLMSSGKGGTSYTNRVQEISEISRSLKALARELRIPIMALSQLSRAVELRPSKVPQLSDLRECVTGDTEVFLADGSTAPIASLVGKKPDVIAIDENRKIMTAKSDKVWKVGKKPVFKVILESGREIKATENHRLLSVDGWCEIGNLEKGDRLGLSRHLPEPQNPVVWPDLRITLLGQLIGDGSYLKGQPMRYTTNSAENSRIVREAAETEFKASVKRYKGRRNWHQLLISGNGNRWQPAGVNKWLRDLGIFGQRSHEKSLPDIVYRFSNKQVALLLRHLWATDGTIFTRKSGQKGSHVIHFSTNSHDLATGVSSLLMRFGIVARINKVQKESYRPTYMVCVTGAEDMQRFINIIGAFGPRIEQAKKLGRALNNVVPNSNVDTVPKKIFDRVKDLMILKGISRRRMAAIRGTSYGGNAHFMFAPSRGVLEEYAEVLNDDELRSYCRDDIFWDNVKKVEYMGIQDVYDLTVPGPACWLTGQNIWSHNSGAIEQDADVVMMMYREEYYEEDSDRPGVTDIYIRKHRNGPTGRIEMAFKKEQMRFLSIDKGHRVEDYAGGELSTP